jgi:hypothetical protein
MNNSVSIPVTLGSEFKRSKWTEAVLFHLREQPLRESELKIYNNSYIKEQWKLFICYITRNTNKVIPRKQIIVEEVRQKWQYNILEYLKSDWIPLNDKVKIKREFIETDLIDPNSISITPDIEEIIKNKKIKIEYED